MTEQKPTSFTAAEEAVTSLTCVNCGHPSPHVQQYGDECWCGCAEYDCPRYPAQKGSLPVAQGGDTP